MIPKIDDGLIYNSPEAQAWNLAMFGNNRFFAFCISYTVVPVMNGHHRDQAKVSVHCRWPLIRGNLTLKCVGRGIDNGAVKGRWPLTTGVAQGRYYCRGIDEILPEWELASGLAFLESKMAALKSIFLNNSRSKGNIMLNHVSVMQYLVTKSSIMIILDHLVSS